MCNRIITVDNVVRMVPLTQKRHIIRGIVSHLSALEELYTGWAVEQVDEPDDVWEYAGYYVPPEVIWMVSGQFFLLTFERFPKSQGFSVEVKLTFYNFGTARTVDYHKTEPFTAHIYNKRLDSLTDLDMPLIENMLIEFCESFFSGDEKNQLDVHVMNLIFCPEAIKREL